MKSCHMSENMDSTVDVVVNVENTAVQNESQPARTENFSQNSQDSQTASEFIDSQLQLEADAREALPYAFISCTQPLGALRQALFSCLTCNPPPASPSDPYTPAAVCYSCSIACHGKHELVELFHKRNFTCDCGTTRLPPTSPCTLRINPATGMKGPVHSEVAAPGNTYNQNFRNRFCGCQQVYDVRTEKGTMYQCLCLGTEAEGGCGEDWWHPECLLGLPRDWFEGARKADARMVAEDEHSDPITEEKDQTSDWKPHPSPPGFPDEEDAFAAFICYKCVELNPWIKRYAGSPGFLPPIYYQPEGHNKDEKKVGGESNSVDLASSQLTEKSTIEKRVGRECSNVHLATSQPTEDSTIEKKEGEESNIVHLASSQHTEDSIIGSKKRGAEDDVSDTELSSLKKPKMEDGPAATTSTTPTCHYSTLPPPPTGLFSLLLSDDFRDQFCRCPSCYPTLAKHGELLEEEAPYEPPLSEDGDNGEVGGSVGTGSLLDRGEAALSNIDRVQALEGVMVYNHLKEKVKAFLQPFADSGQLVGAEDIKAYFETLRGDAEGIIATGGAAVNGDGNGGNGGDDRKEQSGY